jgi:hypothetical protein
LVTLIEGDVLSIGGEPILTLLTNLKTHAGNAVMQSADVLQFTAAAPLAGLELGVQLEQQLLGLAITKLQAAMAAKAAPAPGISG